MKTQQGRTAQAHKSPAQEARPREVEAALKPEITTETPLFHGARAVIKEWSLQHLSSGRGHDQEGPGIYFTTDPEDARGYGRVVHEVRLNLRATVPLKGHVSPATVKALILASPECVERLEDWGEEPNEALLAATDLILDSHHDEPQQVFQQIWYDFYHNHSEDYLRNMVKLGYDGFVVDRSSTPHGADKPVTRRHVVVFNVDSIVPPPSPGPDLQEEGRGPHRLRSRRAPVKTGSSTR